MRIQKPDPKPRDDGDYRVDPTPGYGKPTTDIWLDEKGELRLLWLSESDCERLIRAAAKGLEDIRRYAAQMAAPHGRNHIYQGTCQLCGKPEDDDLHADPAPAREAAPHGDPDAVAEIAARFDAAEHGEREPAGWHAADPAELPPPCGQRPPGNSPGGCARFEGHRPPHRNLAGFEWGEEETEGDEYLCAAAGPDSEPDLRCSLPYGHKGDHSASGEMWPWTGDEEIGRWADVAAGADPFAIPSNRIGGAR